MAKFNIEKAKQAGYSDLEIQKFLDQNPDVSVEKTSKKEGFKIPDKVKTVAASINPIRSLENLTDATKSLIEGESPKQAFNKLTALPTPEDFDKDIHRLTAPARGMRGLGVAAQRAVQGEGLAKSLERGAEAVKPGFEPEKGEKIGSFVGETVGTMPLAVLGGGTGAGAGITNLGKLGFQVIRSGATTAGLTALEQASEQGLIKPGEIAASAAIGGGLPLIKPSAQLIKKAARKIIPKISEFLTGTPQAAIFRKIDKPQSLLNTKGTEEAIEQRVIGVQKAIKEARNRVGNLRNKELKRLGIVVEETEEDLLARVAQGEAPTVPLKEITNSLKTIKQNPSMNPISKIKTLLDMRTQLKAHINHVKLNQQVRPISDTFQRDLTRLNKLINQELDKIPQAKRLRIIDRAYSEANTLYDNLQKKIAETGKAEDFLESLFMGKGIGKMKGIVKHFLKDLSRVEKLSKMNVMEPLEQEFTAQALKQILPKRGLGLFVGLAGSGVAGAANPIAGLAGIIALSPRATSAAISGAQNLTKVATSPKTQALLRALMSR